MAIGAQQEIKGLTDTTQQDIKGLTGYGTFYKVELAPTVGDLDNTNNIDNPPISIGQDPNNDESPDMTIVTTKEKKTKKKKLKMLTVSSIEDNQTFINQDGGLEILKLATPNPLESNFVKIDAELPTPPNPDLLPEEPKRKKKKKRDRSISQKKKLPKDTEQDK